MTKRKINRLKFEGSVPRSLKRRPIKHIADEFLFSEGIEGGVLNIIFTDTDNIHRINADFRGKDKPTDVITFSMLEGYDTDFSMNMLGDIYICPAMLPDDEEYANARCIFHGLVHIAGYEHGQRGKKYDEFISIQESLILKYREMLNEH